MKLFVLVLVLTGCGCPLERADQVVVCVACEGFATCDLCQACRDRGADLAAYCPAGTVAVCDVESVQDCMVQVCEECP